MVESVSLTCGTCGVPFSRPANWPSRKVPYCSRRCWYKRPRQSDPDRYRGCLTAPGHPIAPPSGRVPVARMVLFERIGPGSHKCNWCGKTVRWQIGIAGDCLVADHADGNKSNNHPENVVASCPGCNVWRIRERVAEADPHIPRTDGRGRRKAVSRNCEHCGSPFLVEASEKRINHGRFCSRSCARYAQWMP